MTRKWNKLRLPVWCIVFYAIGATSLLLLFLALVSARFANFYNATLGALLRATTAHATSFLPFSIAELLLYALPFVAIGLGIFATRRYSETWRDVVRFLAMVGAVAALILALFLLSLGIGYHTDPLDARLV